MSVDLDQDAEKFEGRKPDYKLSVIIKGTKSTRKCGVAWRNTNGSIAIALDPCTVLSWKDSIHITLFPEKA
jgi:hypothetical protein